MPCRALCKMRCRSAAQILAQIAQNYPRRAGGPGVRHYFFTDDNVDFPSNSQVWHLDYDDSNGTGQQLSLLLPEAPIRIVGAGVSTCAPPDPQ